MYLFVCTGNTCRSPMAAALWRLRGHEAESAGIYAMQGSAASGGAIRAMEEWKIDLGAHRAHPDSADSMARAEKIVAMTGRHAQALLDQFPMYADKIVCMPRDIQDPFGGDDEDYIRCAREIDEALDML